jgi:hypothetical protein
MDVRVKYPRTYHLPWSLGITSDDKVLRDTSQFIGKEIVVTEKMDGECTSMSSTHIHARSTTYTPHPSRTWVRRFHAEIKHLIPEGWRVCGENLYATHSIRYENLLSYFLGFSLWNEDMALGWDETVEYFELMGVVPVSTLWRGIYNEPFLRTLANSLDPTAVEGYVIRLTKSFCFVDFSRSVAKYVRACHVQTKDHWTYQSVAPNKLKG